MFWTCAISVGIVVLSCLVCFVKQRHHLFLSIICLEGVVLRLALLYMVVRGQSEIFFTFIIFVFGACEASLGLACLVSIIRTFGRDQFKIINSLKC